MKSILLSLIAVAFLLDSCTDPAKKKAFDFNQKLADISNSLHQKGYTMGIEISKATDTKDFSRAKTVYDDLRSFIDQKIPELETTPNTNGSENLKGSMLEFLKFEKRMIKESFDPFLKMDKDTPDSVIQSAIQAFVKESNEENDYLGRVQQAQREFAAHNGLKLKE